ncbi:ornithine carbamoyltransferase [Desulfovibrio litoralis]|uniref:Ornithine carbamoyltransferase n=1 Tax=Desulfovibrio litoralis DSM 11393 TaxID=1121455 RepID=A0A1M7T8I4_9BACT|nr:ornithine carbamoyltransferase [Desulfovibrio litoralis]SHN67028.1 ornithine carbamoyltransferase [Desulfovibrio litoralis DSM 11393]
MRKHFVKILDFTPSEALNIIKRAKEMKENNYRSDLLKNKTILMIFEKASTRTRLSFDVAIHQLGGDIIFMTPNESQLGRSEPLKDTARVVSRYCDGMVVRTFSEDKILELIKYGSVPVVNALTDQGHPCQVMCDVLTMYERTPKLDEIKVAWIGDGNNMANSMIEAAILFNFELHLACPKGFTPDATLLEKAKQAKAKIFLTDKPEEAIKDADYVHTDVWASMGQEHEQKARELSFKGYCVDNRLMSLAKKDAKFMHCLPAHRGEEVSEEVFESPNSIVFDQAENRLHVQKAILEWCFTK